jgi:Flp pilus assembly protein TadD/LmbE family N-acetylglucosaminyl deacetylase
MTNKRKQLALITSNLADGNFFEAERLSEELLELFPNFAPALHLKGLALGKAGKFSEGAHEIKSALMAGDLQAVTFVNYVCLIQASQAEISEILSFIVGQICRSEIVPISRAKIVIELADALQFNKKSALSRIGILVDEFFLPLILWSLANGEISLAEQIDALSHERGLICELLLPLQELMQKKGHGIARNFEKVLNEQEDFHNVLHAYAILSIENGNLKQALHRILRAISIIPNKAGYWHTLGNIYRELNIPEYAEKAYRTALLIQPENIECILDFSDMLLRTFQATRALPLLEKAVTDAPDHADGHELFAAVSRVVGNVEIAICETENIIRLRPNEKFEWISDYARLLLISGRSDECELVLQEAASFAPDKLAWHWQLAEFLRSQGRLDEAKFQYDCVAELDKISEFPGRTYLSQAHVFLEQGDLKAGWKEYRKRTISHSNMPFRDFKVPTWHGESLCGFRIVLWCEQGVADEIWFSSLLPELVKLGASVAVECDRRLLALLQRSFLNVIFFPREATESLPPGFKPDYQSSLMDLSEMLRSDIESFDAHPSAYLIADHNLKTKWRERLKATNSRMCIGISWRSIRSRWAESGTTYPTANAIVAILRHPRIRWINLQYEVYESELQEFERLSGAKLEMWPGFDLFNDLDGQAALLTELDLIIAPGNLPAVLGAALGCEVLCPWSSTLGIYWRSLGTGRMPWFPTMTIYPRESWHDWDVTAQKILERISSLSAVRNSTMANDAREVFDKKVGITNAVMSTLKDTSLNQVQFSSEFEPAKSMKEDYVGIEEVYNHFVSAEFPPQNCPSEICAIIIPIGPGHKELSRQGEASVRAAAANGTGKFARLIIILVDDQLGEMGRSTARNIGTRKAQELGATWVFFLDADDVMHEQAFMAVSPFMADYDAIWGQICEMSFENDNIPKLREGQAKSIANIERFLATDPYHSVQMGHFVRINVSIAHKFDTTLDAGEDFKYYASIWNDFRCIKIKEVLFINRRGQHSRGPRSENGGVWRKATEKIISTYWMHRQYATNWLDSGDYAIVVAHPDDEALWFSSILQRAKRVIVCYGDFAMRPTFGPARRAVFEEYPLSNVVFLDMCEPVSYKFGDWAEPSLNSKGMVLVDDAASYRYSKNFDNLLERLRPLLADVSYLFTHNPWGEYGHEDHVQVGMAAREAVRPQGARIFVPLCLSSMSERLMHECKAALSDRMVTVPGNVELADELKAIYQKHDCWTWDNNWRAAPVDHYLMLNRPNETALRITGDFAGVSESRA